MAGMPGLALRLRLGPIALPRWPRVGPGGKFLRGNRLRQDDRINFDYRARKTIDLALRASLAADGPTTAQATR